MHYITKTHQNARIYATRSQQAISWPSTTSRLIVLSCTFVVDINAERNGRRTLENHKGEKRPEFDDISADSLFKRTFKLSLKFICSCFNVCSRCACQILLGKFCSFLRKFESWRSCWYEQSTFKIPVFLSFKCLSKTTLLC